MLAPARQQLGAFSYQPLPLYAAAAADAAAVLGLRETSNLRLEYRYKYSTERLKVKDVYSFSPELRLVWDHTVLPATRRK